MILLGPWTCCKMSSDLTHRYLRLGYLFLYVYSIESTSSCSIIRDWVEIGHQVCDVITCYQMTCGQKLGTEQRSRTEIGQIDVDILSSY